MLRAGARSGCQHEPHATGGLGLRTEGACGCGKRRHVRDGEPATLSSELAARMWVIARVRVSHQGIGCADLGGAQQHAILFVVARILPQPINSTHQARSKPGSPTAGGAKWTRNGLERQEAECGDTIWNVVGHGRHTRTQSARLQSAGDRHSPHRARTCSRLLLLLLPLRLQLHRLLLLLLRWLHARDRRQQITGPGPARVATALQLGDCVLLQVLLLHVLLHLLLLHLLLLLQVLLLRQRARRQGPRQGGRVGMGARRRIPRVKSRRPLLLLLGQLQMLGRRRLQALLLLLLLLHLLLLRLLLKRLLLLSLLIWRWARGIGGHRDGVPAQLSGRCRRRLRLSLFLPALLLLRTHRGAGGNGGWPKGARQLRAAMRRLHAAPRSPNVTSHTTSRTALPAPSPLPK